MCGILEGVINIFNWGEWGNISDRFLGYFLLIDCMVLIIRDIVCIGFSDGIVRYIEFIYRFVIFSI